MNSIYTGVISKLGGVSWCISLLLLLLAISDNGNAVHVLNVLHMLMRTTVSHLLTNFILGPNYL